jgi:pimeloyl-ACP methyl ester carboxylesterase
VDSLEVWRERVGLEKFILVGHSLGGLLSASYAMKYPKRVEKLVLVGCAGVGHPPEDYDDDLVFLKEKYQVKPWTFRSLFISNAKRIWNSNWTPFSIIRCAGPWGRNLVTAGVKRRYATAEDMTLEEKETFANYIYHIVAQKGSGEFTLRHLLRPLAYAYDPLMPKLPDMPVPVAFVYGESDWMSPQSGHEAVAKAKEKRRPYSRHDLSVHVIPNGGHMIFIEQPEAFHRTMMEICAPHMNHKRWKKN